MKLPEFIETAIDKNTTSIGSHPALPPEEDESFLYSVLSDFYNEIMEDVDTTDSKEISRRLYKTLTECVKEEETCKEALMSLCEQVCCKIIDIPDDTLTIHANIVSECNMDKYRMVPDHTPDFEFDDIDDMRTLTNAVYKRRMMNVLISGAAITYAYDISYYLNELYKINPRLVGLYTEIVTYNFALLMNKKDTFANIEKTNSGRVDVTIGGETDKIIIDSQGVIFPILLEYTIRGLLDVASLHGLPKVEKKAEYVLGKADYRLAENWDMRLGIPLWGIIKEEIESLGADVDEIGVNYIIMEISRMDDDYFNTYLQNTFKRTKLAHEMNAKLIKQIEYNKGKSDFDNFIKVKNDKFQINDDTYYTPDELLREAEADEQNE